MDCTGAGSRFDRSSFSIPSVTPDGSRSCQRQVAHPDQIVGGQREGKHPIDPRHSAMVRFAQTGDRFEPAEDFLDALTLALTDLIVRMTSGPLIDDRGGLAGKVWGDLVIAQLLNQFLAVVALIGAEGYSMPAGDLCNQRHGRLRFGAAGGLGHAALDCDAVAVLQCAGINRRGVVNERVTR